MSLTVLEILRRSTEFLEARGVESARLNAELILSHVLRQPRLRLYLEFDRVVGAPETAAVRDLVRRRGRREPLQHLTGTAAFLGHELRVGPEVLIPRPETERLAQLAIERLRRPDASATPRVLDFGTGSGCLAIAIAAAIPAAEVHALELSVPALDRARENARPLGTDRIAFHCGDGFAALPDGEGEPRRGFDLLVANPPYIPTADIGSLDPEVRDHEPRLALDGGPDGLSFFRRLAVEASHRMRRPGCLMLEFGDGQAAAVRELFTNTAWTVERVEKDLSGRDRILIVTPLPASRVPPGT
ncbi:MAG: peptide chain release factor N(5)-glutamine methyltransferase [Verrucomicrobiae bacterium]|nr:peptide chain release factor N(5)-glutamine methyltransferase [Verrucomicrobiae bacterium]